MMKRQKTANKPPIFELKIALDDVKPLVWRSFLVDPLCTLPLLHVIIQAVMGWKNCHLYCFVAQGVRYGIKDPEFPNDWRDDRRVRLFSLVKTPGERFGYEYDFGDHWKHTIVLEKTIERSRSVVHPKCIAGENACPPEDVGGVDGYRDLLHVLANPHLPEYAEVRKWVGPMFERNRFDLKYQNLPMWDLRGTVLPKWMWM